MSMQLNTFGFGLPSETTPDLKLFHDIPVEQLRILIDPKQQPSAKVTAYRVVEKFIKAANTSDSEAQTE